MSSATPRRARLLTQLRVLVRGIAWTALIAALALGGAGLVAQLWHPAGGPSRPELTWLGDIELTAALEASEADVRAIADEVDRLAEEARIALATVATGDPELLEASLERGSQQVAAITAAVAALRGSLTLLPGDEPDAALRYRNAVVVRRAALIAAVDAAGGLAGQWSAVRARSSDAADLIRLIDLHDSTVLAAAAEGREGRYRRAIETLATARGVLVEIQEMRVELVAGSETTVLDEWIDRNLTYDLALTALYEALRESRGALTVEVQSAAREERIARAQLPEDRRYIVVVVSEIARGGLNQAVLAIEETRGRIDAALAEATEDDAEPDTDTPAGGG